MKLWKILLASLALATPSYAKIIVKPQPWTPPQPYLGNPNLYVEDYREKYPFFTGDGENSDLQHAEWLTCKPFMGDTVKITITFGEIFSDDGNKENNHIEIARLIVNHQGTNKKVWNRAQQYDMRHRVTTLTKNKTYEWAGLSAKHGRMIGILSRTRGELMYDTAHEYKKQAWLYTENLLDPFKRWKGYPILSTVCVVTKIQAYEDKEEKVSRK